MPLTLTLVLGFGSSPRVIGTGYSHEELDDADGGNGKYMQVERDYLLLSDVQAGLFDDCRMGILRVLVEGTSELTICLFAPLSFISSSRLSSHHPVFCLIIPSFVSSSHLLSHHPVFCLIIPSFVSSSRHFSHHMVFCFVILSSWGVPCPPCLLTLFPSLP